MSVDMGYTALQPKSRLLKVVTGAPGFPTPPQRETPGAHHQCLSFLWGDETVVSPRTDWEGDGLDYQSLVPVPGKARRFRANTEARQETLVANTGNEHHNLPLLP